MRRPKGRGQDLPGRAGRRSRPGSRRNSTATKCSAPTTCWTCCPAASDRSIESKKTGFLEAEPVFFLCRIIEETSLREENHEPSQDHRKAPCSGRTGHWSTATNLRRRRPGRVTQTEPTACSTCSCKYGVNHIDTAATYGTPSWRIGPWMKRPSAGLFSGPPRRRSAPIRAPWTVCAGSLERLQTDQVDLIQLHALIHPDEGTRLWAPAGALEGLIEAREQGLVRYIGSPGTVSPSAPCIGAPWRASEFDSVLLPTIPAHRDAVYMRTSRRWSRLCADNVAVQTIKSLLRGPWGRPQRTSVHLVSAA